MRVRVPPFSNMGGGTVPPLLSATRGHLLSLNYAELHGRPGVCSGPYYGELTALPRPLARLRALLLKGRKSRGGKVKGRRGEVVLPLFGRKSPPCTHAEKFGEY